MRAPLFTFAILCAACSAPARPRPDLGPPPADLSLLFDFSSMNDFAAPLDLAVPSDLAASDRAVPDDLNSNDSSTGDLAPSDAARSSDAAVDGASPDMSVPKSDLEINYCIVQFPKTLAGMHGQPSAPIYGQVFQAGLTDVTMNTPAPGIIAQLGVGPVGSDARSSDAWTWISTLPTPNYNWAQNNDEYQAALPGMSIGVYSYAFRFSVTAGAGFTYCDTIGNGSNNGLPVFDPKMNGQLTVN